MSKHSLVIFIGRTGQRLKDLVEIAKKQGFEHKQFYAEYKSGIWKLSFIT